MNLYLDASVLLPLFIAEQRSDEVQNALAGKVLIVSDFAMAEYSSGISRRVRMGEISEDQAHSLFAGFDTWITRAAQRATLVTGDVLNAMGFVRQFKLQLRTPDAINIAIAQRCNAPLFTFDLKQADAARRLGHEVVG